MIKPFQLLVNSSWRLQSSSNLLLLNALWLY